MEEIFDLLTLAEQDGFTSVRTSTSRGGQVNGSCPWCQGHDRFRIQPHYGPYGWFACSQCERKGTLIDYLMLRRGMSRRRALAAVGWKPREESTLTGTLPAAAFADRPQWDEPHEYWQRAASDFFRSCQETLWSPAGQSALAYLHGRGLSDQTIQAAQLGYHPRREEGVAHVWGQSVQLWQGLVIPWLYQGNVWRLTIRNEHVASGNGRYRQVSGGSNGLYLADSLALRRSTIVVTEGEFDALSVAQVCGEHIAVVATGTTQGGHTPRWVSLLAHQQHVFIAFDGEEKGDTAAVWWLSRLNNAQRLRPLWKDANQMAQEAPDLFTEWITANVLSTAHQPPEIQYSSDRQGQEKPAVTHEAHPQRSTLPSLPREYCPFREVQERGKERRLIGVSCRVKPLANGWCARHQHAQELLNLGASLGYPRIDFEHWAIDGGKCSWEGNAKYLSSHNVALVFQGYGQSEEYQIHAS